MNKNTDIYSAMQTEAPYKTYKKVILGKVFLRALDPFSDEPVGIHLEGNPKSNDAGCFFYVWNEKQDVFLKRMNALHFEKGNMIVWETQDVPEDAPEVKQYSDYTEADIEEIAKYKFFKLQSTLKEANSEAFIFRILSKAEELERPEKTLDEIRLRLSEIQAGEVPDGNTD